MNAIVCQSVDERGSNRNPDNKKFEVCFLRWWLCAFLLYDSCDDKFFSPLFFGRGIDLDSLTDEFLSAIV